MESTCNGKVKLENKKFKSGNELRGQGAVRVFEGVFWSGTYAENETSDI
jgi:hypothetical protein